ncbi:MAG: hypothetical protein J5595_03440, partial [Bacteroidales bacterium]|nr:hypothetical protein [Bacteroidales bacterium]
MPRLKQICMDLISHPLGNIYLKGRWYKLDDYCTDVYSGICQDGDNRSIRYRKDGSLYKMRSGKLFRKIILASPFGKILPEQVQIWLCEEFAIDWETYAASKREIPYKLVTGLNGEITFADIYGNGGYYYMDDLHSCMTGRERHDFYDKSVDDCYPAALVEKDNPRRIVARCVVFNNVEDLESGEIFRLAERQYSSNGEQGMRMLISELKKAGLIDGYKCVGAACSESTNFV